MKKILLLCGMLIAISATVASAAPGVNLAWDNCVGGGGTHVKTFACNSNSGTNVLVASVKAPAGIDMWTAFETTVQFNFGGSQPAWWQLRNQTGQQGQCRNGSLSVSQDFTTITGCEDVYQNNGAGGIGTYSNDDPMSGSARLLLVFAVASGSEVPLTPDVEYYAAKVQINNAKTVGPTACGGCQQPVCALVTKINVVQPAGAPGGNVEVTDPAESNTAVWQAGGDPLCITVGSRRTPWSGVKNLYK